jgi:putative DNA methylase
MITGTWPMRTEQPGGLREVGRSALASSIVLVCRPREVHAGMTDRRGFLTALRGELPQALRDLQKGNTAPVDLAQASIGPGMAVYSRYAKVVESDGSAMRVRAALGLINRTLDEVLTELDADFDPRTRWAVKWFEQFGFDEGPSGQADVLFTATATSLDGVKRAGIAGSSPGKVWLLSRPDLPADWDPTTDAITPVWEVTMHLLKRLEERGEAAAGELLAQAGGVGDTARELAYRLFSICSNRKWASEALALNGLVTSWPEIARLAASGRGSSASQNSMF